MTTERLSLDPAFLDQQKQRLTALRKQLRGLRGSQEGARRNVNADLSGQARELEDDAQRLAALELQDNLSAADEERLSNIDRALIKIEQGTYGLSDTSGKPISMDRLQASPESIYTLEEQAAREAAR
jgi:DnaK suppressor protein